MTTYQPERVPFPTPTRLVKELRLRRPPWWMVVGLVIVVLATWVPLTLIYRARQTRSRSPRVHFVLDMDQQPRFGPQASHAWYADGRAMRQPVEGTIARHRLTHDQHFSLGYLTSDGTATGSVTGFVSSLPPQLIGQESRLAERGYSRFAIYCAPCHGERGAGDGPISTRAFELKEAKWVAPTHLMTQIIRDRADGQLFQAITDGVRNMPGYGSQLSPRDRWAVVVYLRQLQASEPVAPEPVTKKP